MVHLKYYYFFWSPLLAHVDYNNGQPNPQSNTAFSTLGICDILKILPNRTSQKRMQMPMGASACLALRKWALHTGAEFFVGVVVEWR